MNNQATATLTPDKASLCLSLHLGAAQEGHMVGSWVIEYSLSLD